MMDEDTDMTASAAPQDSAAQDDDAQDDMGDRLGAEPMPTPATPAKAATAAPKVPRMAKPPAARAPHILKMNRMNTRLDKRREGRR